jgi:hypothetical protein
MSKPLKKLSPEESMHGPTPRSPSKTTTLKEVSIGIVGKLRSFKRLGI